MGRRLTLFGVAVLGVVTAVAVAAMLFTPPWFDRSPGTIVYSALVAGPDVLPYRVTVSDVDYTPDDKPPALHVRQFYLSIYHFVGFGWTRTFRSPGDSELIAVQRSGAAPSWDFVQFRGAGKLSDEPVFLFSSVSCGASCSGIALAVVAWNNASPRTIGWIVGGDSISRVTFHDSGFTLVGDGFAPDDPHCCPSIHNESAMVSGSTAGLFVSANPVFTAQSSDKSI